MTPTFAAGLGVVVAAVLAYPMQTVFNYAAPNTATCSGERCGPPGGGEPASVPGDHLTAPGQGSGGAPAAKRHRKEQGGQALTAAPHLSYQTSARVSGGFHGTIMIDFRPQAVHERWWLGFSYPSARILRVWAGRYVRHGPHGAVVASWDWPGPAAHRRLVHVSIEVAGHPGPPAGCFFDGRACHFGGRHAGGPGAGGAGGSGAGRAGGSGAGRAGGPGPAHAGQPGSARTGRRTGSGGTRGGKAASTAG